MTATVPVSRRLPNRWPGRNAAAAIATRAPFTMSSEFAQQHVDHAPRARRVVGAVAVDEHIHLGLDVREHAAHDVAFALEGFAADDGAGLRGALARGVARVVVVDVDRRLGQRGGEVASRRFDRLGLVVTRDQHRDARARAAMFAAAVRCVRSAKTWRVEVMRCAYSMPSFLIR